MDKRLIDFRGGLRQTDRKGLIRDNEFVAGKNLVPQVDGTAKKRQGRNLIGQVVTDNYKITGLIQNETEAGAKELYATVLTDLYYKDISSWISKFSGFTDNPFYSEYWQNQVFWGNGIENIINRKTKIISRIFVGDTFNHKIKLIDKDSPYSLLGLFGEKGSGDAQFQHPHGIAVDGNYIYVADRANDKIKIFTKEGVFVNDFAVTEPYALSVDSSYIYIINGHILIYDKASPYAQVYDSGGVAGIKVISISVDNKYFYFAITGSEIYIRNKLTQASVDNFFAVDSTVTGIGEISGIAVDRLEMDDQYIYVGRRYTGVNDVDRHVFIYNKTSPYALVRSFGVTSSIASEPSSDYLVGDIKVDNDYIYVLLNKDELIKIYNKVSPYALVASIGAGGSTLNQFNKFYNLDVDWSVDTKRISYLDAPAKPLCCTDVISGNITAGSYKYKVSFFNGSQETNVGLESDAVVIGGGDTAEIWIRLLDNSIPENITHWNIFRSKDGGFFYKLAVVVVSTYEYLDNIVHDSSFEENAIPSKQSGVYSFINSKIFTFFKEQLWISKGKYLYWSYPYQPNYFPSVNILQVDTRTDIIALKGSEFGLFAFTSNSFNILEGWNADNYNLREISDSVGALTHRGVQEYLKLLIWLDEDGIYISEGGAPEKISKDRIDTLISSIQIDKKDYICSILYNDKFLLALPTSSGNDYNDKVLVFDFILRCFYIIDGWKIHDFSIIEDDNDNHILYGGSNDSGIYQLFTGNADDDSDGTPQNIVCDIETKHFDLGAEELRKLFKSLYALTGNDGSNGITFDFKWKIGNNSEETRSITCSKEKAINKVRPVGARGKDVYFKIEETGQNEFTIFGFGANITVLKKEEIDNQGG